MLEAGMKLLGQGVISLLLFAIVLCGCTSPASSKSAKVPARATAAVRSKSLATVVRRLDRYFHLAGPGMNRKDRQAISDLLELARHDDYEIVKVIREVNSSYDYKRSPDPYTYTDPNWPRVLLPAIKYGDDPFPSPFELEDGMLSIPSYGPPNGVPSGMIATKGGILLSLGVALTEAAKRSPERDLSRLERMLASEK
jgi:hypothetical protein